MSWYPNGYVAGAKPTGERVKERQGTRALGQAQKSMADIAAEQEAKADLALKRRLHQPVPETWTIEKVRHPYTKAGRWEVGVRRDLRGRFASELPAGEVATILAGVTTGTQVQSMSNREGS
ncbi:MAG: hypothetical protein ACM3TU_02805 [Bacillota bacterium]